MSKRQKSILDMNCDEARTFFMKEENYCTLQLPEYFSFKEVLKQADDILKSKNNKQVSVDIQHRQKNNKKIYTCPELNQTVIINKNGKYDWRPIKIVHPVPYVDLVNTITSKNNWEKILNRFKDFEENRSIRCVSMPRQALGIHNNNTKETILNWWEEFEQYSIEAALRYSYCIQTDITNCYGSIYTHTIAWAIETKKVAKENHKSELLGNAIDIKIRNMQGKQTNGIPQGSALFDFIAEIILGFADSILSKKIKSKKVGKDYQIIRYRDDYRIFSNSKEEAEVITKLLADTLLDLNMHLNTKKTKSSTDLIGLAIKPDKLYWNSRRINIFSVNKTASGKTKNSINYHMNLQKHLLEIYILSKKFPNSGSIKKAFSEYLERIDHLNALPRDYKQLISITANIIVSNPNAIPQGVAVISHIFGLMKNKIPEKLSDNLQNFVSEIYKKLQSIPNTDYLEIWLQRISIAVDNNQFECSTPLCKKVIDNEVNIWDSTWLEKGFIESSVINNDKLNKIELPIPKDNVNPFTGYC